MLFCFLHISILRYASPGYFCSISRLQPRGSPSSTLASILPCSQDNPREIEIESCCFPTPNPVTGWSPVSSTFQGSSGEEGRYLPASASPFPITLLSDLQHFSSPKHRIILSPSRPFLPSALRHLLFGWLLPHRFQVSAQTSLPLWGLLWHPAPTSPPQVMCVPMALHWSIVGDLKSGTLSALFSPLHAQWLVYTKCLVNIYWMDKWTDGRMDQSTWNSFPKIII